MLLDKYEASETAIADLAGNDNPDAYVQMLATISPMAAFVVTFFTIHRETRLAGVFYSPSA